MNDTYRYACLMLSIILIFGTISQINAEISTIPNWIRKNAKLWYQGQIEDSDFSKGLQYLIENKVMIISPIGEKISHESKIPSWIKHNAGLWANKTISDNEFVSGIQYLISSGIISLRQNTTQSTFGNQCIQFVTAAEKETCFEQLEYDTKIKNSIQTAMPYVVGPITFYYVNSESQKTDDGKTILTIHFVVQNNGSHEVTMTCLHQDSCNYALSDGHNEISYSTNTLVYGSLTLAPNSQKFLDWTFYNSFDSSKNYSFLIREPWGSGSIPIKIS